MTQIREVFIRIPKHQRVRIEHNVAHDSYKDYHNSEVPRPCQIPDTSFTENLNTSLIIL